MHLRVFLPAAILSFSSSAAARDTGEFLKTHLFADGFVEWTLQPPRNEMDANLRRPDLIVETGGFGYAFARYSLRGQFQIGLHLNNRIVKNAFLIIKPDILFGETIPQRTYTWSAAPIGYVKNFGIGVTLPGNVKVYVEAHRWEFFGKHKLGLPPGGPKGLYNAIVVRKEFRLNSTY